MKIEENLEILACDDNRFEIIAKAKEHLLRATNIEDAPEEMAVIDNILFRCWQMGWLKKNEEPQLPANLDKAAKDAQQDLYDGFYSGHIEAYQEAFKRGAKWMEERIKESKK